MIRIGVVAPSSVIPKVEFELGVAFLQDQGYQVEIHPEVFDEHFFYSASDENRARSFIEYASRDDLDAIWCARGGYGATHLLPMLDRAKKKLQAKRKKALLGYSDATALLEWTRVNLGWNTIHAPMPSLRTFRLLDKDEWRVLSHLIEAACLKKKAAKYRHSLTPIFLPKNFKNVEAPLVGGNLFVWNTLLGTKNAGNAKGKILFLEEVGENVARINRMVHHLEQARGLQGVKAIVLGDFLDCPDTAPQCLKVHPGADVELESFLRSPPKKAMGPLRKIHSTDASLEYIFRSAGERNNIPVFKGVPAGHGPNYSSLYLGKKHGLTKSGVFTLS